MLSFDNIFQNSSFYATKIQFYQEKYEELEVESLL